MYDSVARSRFEPTSRMGSNTLRTIIGPVVTTTTIIILLLSSLGRVSAVFKFEVLIHSYRNPTHASQDSNGGCCDSSVDHNMPPTCRSDCDTYVIVCLREVSNAGVSLRPGLQQCPYGLIETDELQNMAGNMGDNIQFNFGEQLDISEELYNPLEFIVTAQWKGSIQVIIQVFDRDSGNDDWIDIEFLTHTSSPLSSGSSQFSNPTIYNGNGGFSQITLSFRVSCADNYYGSDCTTYCVGRNDTAGHYTCREDGSIVCNEGYFYTSTNCTECLPSFGCSLIGGYCTMPYECLCHQVYTGDNCTSIIETDSMTGAIAGSIAVVLFLLVISMLIILALVVIISKRKQSQCSNEATNQRRRSSGPGLQENASYIDLISNDTLTRSTNLNQSIQNEERISPASTQSKSYYKTPNHDQQPIDPLRTNSLPEVDNHSTVNSNHGKDNAQALSLVPDNPETNLNHQEGYTAILLQANQSYTKSHNSTVNSEHREEIMSLSQNQSYRVLENSAAAVSNHSEQVGVPLSRNRSYGMLDTEDTSREQNDVEVYSYPHVHRAHSKPQEHCLNTKSDSALSLEPGVGTYSMIELSNMGDDNQVEDNNMVANGVYGGFDDHLADDSYVNEGLGPSTKKSLPQ